MLVTNTVSEARQTYDSVGSIGTETEATGHYAIWSIAVGDDLQDLELFRAGATGSLRISDLTTNLERGYFVGKPVSSSAIIALVRVSSCLNFEKRDEVGIFQTRLHLNRINAAQILLTTSTTLAAGSAQHAATCTSFATLQASWSATLLALRQSVAPNFSPSRIPEHLT